VISTAAVSIAAVLTLSACNGSDDTTAVDQLSPVAAIQKVADTAGNDSATYTFELAGKGVSVKGSGAYAGGAHPAMEMTFASIKAAGFSMPAGTEFRIVDDVMYLKSSKGGIIPGVGDGSWVKLPMGEVEDSNSSFGDLTMTNPVDQLKKMLDTQDVKKVGTETIDGAKTTHYRASIDSMGNGTVTEKKSSSNQNELSRQLEEQLSNSIKDSMGLTKPVTVDAWVDGSYHARKLQMTLPFLGEMTMTMKFADFGSDVKIDAPVGAKEMDVSKMLSGQLGDEFSKQFGDEFNKEFGDDFSFGNGQDFSSDEFQKQLQEQIEKSLKDHGVSGSSARGSDDMDALVSS